MSVSLSLADLRFIRTKDDNYNYNNKDIVQKIIQNIKE